MQEYETLLDKLCERVYVDSLRFQGGIPRTSTDVNGAYQLGGMGGWTDAFFPGMLYLCYGYSGQEKFLKEADRYQPYFTKRAENDADWCQRENVLPLDHDTGFLFKLTQVYRWKLTGDEHARALALQAARNLAGRFHEKGGFIRAWDTWAWDKDPAFIEEKKGKAIVDSMMNIALLFWAWEQSGEEEFFHIARTHADTLARHIVREDGSTYHQYNFDPQTGAPLRGVTGQGYSDESCWSRGQGWAIYGFAETYLYTKDPLHLETAKRAARYFMEHLTPMDLPLWDFDCGSLTLRPFDSSAAAVAASGLITLWRVSGKEEYLQGAQRLLRGLLTHCSALDIPGWESLLLHGCIGRAYAKGAENVILNPYLDSPLIYGDYYFLEALVRMARPQMDTICLK